MVNLRTSGRLFAACRKSIREATFQNNVGFRRVAWQDSGMDAEPGFLGQLGPSLLRVLPLLDERSRRLVLGMAAEAEGKGGAGRVAALTGASWQTVANGKAELASEEELPPGRQRRPGGGRKTLAETDPGLAAALEK